MLNLIYYWATRNAQDEAALAKFDRKLWMPPKGEEAPAESPWSAQNETDAFKAFKAQIQPDGPPKPAAPTTASATPKQRGPLASNSNGPPGSRGRPNGRGSEEHTSELTSPIRISFAVSFLKQNK